MIDNQYYKDKQRILQLYGNLFKPPNRTYKTMTAFLKYEESINYFYERISHPIKFQYLVVSLFIH